MSKPREINALAVTGLSAAAISITPGAHEYRASLLAISKAITEVDEFTLDAASDALKLIQETTRAVEKQRVKEKAPALDFGKQIDSAAKEFCGPLEEEVKRLAALIGGYVTEQQRIAREAEQARQKAIADAAAAQRKAEEEARKAAAAAEPDDDFPPMPPPAPAPVLLAPIPPPVVAPPKVAGVQVRTTWKYEVTDIAALFAARPDLCTIEPNAAAIRAELPKDKPIPGLRAWTESNATSTTSKS
jgi:hypothetical protein